MNDDGQEGSCAEQGRVQDDDLLSGWHAWMLERELAPSTMARYEREARRFCLWLENRGGAGVGIGATNLANAAKEDLVAYKGWLVDAFSPSGANVAVAALNSLCTFMGRADLRLKAPRIQASGIRPQSSHLDYEEYERLVRAAEALDDGCAALVVQALCSAGLRVSELSYLTVEAAQEGSMWVANKGKMRQVILPSNLSVLILEHCRGAGLASGPVFVGKSGAPLGRTTIWRWIKAAAALAGIPQKKAYPHNLRHLFALRYYENYRDLNAVSDALGHSKLETTRIYLATTAAERRAQIESLGLVCGKPKTRALADTTIYATE